MNLKTTPLLFGVLLGILWLFGLMLVYKKGAVDENLIMPTMQGPDVKVDTVRVQYKDKKSDDELVFQEENDQWFLQQHGQKVKVEGFRINDLIRQIKDARRYEEDRIQDDTHYYDLPPAGQPRITFTLTGKVKEREKKWTFFVGKTGSAEFLIYVNSSDRSTRALPVVRSSLDALLFKDTTELRSKRLFDLVAETVTSVFVKEGKEELELKKTDNAWRFEKPPYGFAGFETTGPAPAPGQDDFLKKDKEVSGVRALIDAITHIHVDNEKDFEPLGVDLAKYGVTEGDATMRIALGTGSEKPDKDKKEDAKGEKKEKESPRETLLIGKRIPGVAAKKTEEQYYARLLADQGVFRISAKLLEPIKQAVAHPSASAVATRLLSTTPRSCRRGRHDDDPHRQGRQGDEGHGEGPAAAPRGQGLAGDRRRREDASRQRQGHHGAHRGAAGQEGHSGVR